jgi:hypothetical protein
MLYLTPKQVELLITVFTRPLTPESNARVQAHLNAPRFKIDQNLSQESRPPKPVPVVRKPWSKKGRETAS